MQGRHYQRGPFITLLRLPRHSPLQTLTTDDDNLIRRLYTTEHLKAHWKAITEICLYPSLHCNSLGYLENCQPTKFLGGIAEFIIFSDSQNWCNLETLLNPTQMNQQQSINGQKSYFRRFRIIRIRIFIPGCAHFFMFSNKMCRKCSKNIKTASLCGKNLSFWMISSWMYGLLKTRNQM